MRLTRAEEQVMKILWDLTEGIVKDIRDRFYSPKPARNTVSTVLRVLERKGFITHKAYGNVHLYSPVVTKREYSVSQLLGLMDSYFNNSFALMASFYAKEKGLSFKELEEMVRDAKKEMQKTKKKKAGITGN